VPDEIELRAEELTALALGTRKPKLRGRGSSLMSGKPASPPAKPKKFPPDFSLNGRTLSSSRSMGYYVARLNRPYDFRVLIETYIYTQRQDFVHTDFKAYYASLLEALQRLFQIRLSDEGLAFGHRVLWKLFQSTIHSLLQITNPWAGYLEASLLHIKLEETGEPGKVVHTASAAISEANTASEIAHREILHALFSVIFGECKRIVTSEELLQAGFDDSKEPESSSYYDEM
jgi:hypothetical protein